MNKTMLLGRITKDIELKYTQNGTAVTKFTLAVNRQFVKQGEERQADFIPCVAWGKTAEFIAKYMGKGSQIAVSGRLQSGQYEDKDGKKVYTLDLVVEDVYFADSKKENSGGGNKANDTYEYNNVDTDDLPF